MHVVHAEFFVDRAPFRSPDGQPSKKAVARSCSRRVLELVAGELPGDERVEAMLRLNALITQSRRIGDRTFVVVEAAAAVGVAGHVQPDVVWRSAYSTDPSSGRPASRRRSVPCRSRTRRLPQGPAAGRSGPGRRALIRSRGRLRRGRQALLGEPGVDVAVDLIDPPGCPTFVSRA